MLLLGMQYTENVDALRKIYKLKMTNNVILHYFFALCIEMQLLNIFSEGKISYTDDYIILLFSSIYN